MKNVNNLKLNILVLSLFMAFTTNADDVSLTELYGPAAFDYSSNKVSSEVSATAISDYDFNQINGTGQITSGDIAAIKQIVIAEPTTTNTSANNVATPVTSPMAQATQQPATPLVGQTAYTTGVNMQIISTFLILPQKP